MKSILKKIKWNSLLLLCALISLSGCSSFNGYHCRYKKAKEAYANINGLGHSQAKGTLEAISTGRKKAKVILKIHGLKPNAKYHFRFHEFGNCKKEGTLAGKPWGRKKHKNKRKNKKHGKSKNLVADANGKINYSQEIRLHVNKILGRSIVIHSGKKKRYQDKTRTHVACGIIVAPYNP